MKHFLLKAFEGACALTTPIKDTYDSACFKAMQLYIDHRFLHIPDHLVPYPHLKPIANTFNHIKGIAQNKLLDSISSKNASGDFGPKPDIKPKLINLGMNILTHMPRITPATTAVVTLGIGVGLVSYMLMTHGVSNLAITDSIATYLGGKTNTPPAPQNQIV